jgi:hypothetical protein
MKSAISCMEGPEGSRRSMRILTNNARRLSDETTATLATGAFPEGDWRGEQRDAMVHGARGILTAIRHGRP